MTKCKIKYIITFKGWLYMAVKRQNMSIDPVVYQDFLKYSELKGIKVSTWVTMKMKEFVEEEKALEELKKNKK